MFDCKKILPADIYWQHCKVYDKYALSEGIVEDGVGSLRTLDKLLRCAAKWKGLGFLEVGSKVKRKNQ